MTTWSWWMWLSIKSRCYPSDTRRSTTIWSSPFRILTSSCRTDFRTFWKTFFRAVRSCLTSRPSFSTSSLFHSSALTSTEACSSCKTTSARKACLARLPMKMQAEQWAFSCATEMTRTETRLGNNSLQLTAKKYSTKPSESAHNCKSAPCWKSNTTTKWAPALVQP